MLDLEERDGVAVIHLHGRGHNRLDTPLLRRLAAAMEFIGPAHPVVLTGYRRTFAIGAEISAPIAAVSPAGDTTRPARPQAIEELLTAQDDALRAVAEHPAPVVAAVNGDAIDTGFALAAAADIRLMERGLIGTVFAAQGTAPLSGVGVELVRDAFACCGAPMPSGALAFTATEAEAAGFVERPRRLTQLLDEAVDHARTGVPIPQRM
ncbi:enoyl-CoA hydratase/isomerase family protein [Haloechinothrix halophila]|uniref:enoyl-CoA hydratase/isomerase family protein n=1 Tax=Haloechinothrix halophila TaxID=1069073 RepID=UPI0004162F72|nr:enoyl-CoA hydratase/isomerase family protein [Haloechinothrix halophila]